MESQKPRHTKPAVLWSYTPKHSQMPETSCNKKAKWYLVIHPKPNAAKSQKHKKVKWYGYILYSYSFWLVACFLLFVFRYLHNAYVFSLLSFCYILLLLVSGTKQCSRCLHMRLQIPNWNNGRNSHNNHIITQTCSLKVLLKITHKLITCSLCGKLYWYP